MPKPNEWSELIRTDPQHSQRYAERFRRLAAEGNDIYGEARMVDAMLPRGSRVLDAGCGGGRVGGFLAGAGHSVLGVDQDQVLIDAAQQDYPQGTWLVGDLAELDQLVPAINQFDAVVCAGNVMTFLHPETRTEVLAGFAARLERDGRIITGFGSGRGYEFADYVADLESVGLIVDLALSTWDLRPFDQESSFLVAILCHR